MEPKIEIYDDYCVDMDSNDIQTILSQITALVTDAVLRATAQKKDEDDAAYSNVGRCGRSGRTFVLPAY